MGGGGGARVAYRWTSCGCPCAFVSPLHDEGLVGSGGVVWVLQGIDVDMNVSTQDLCHRLHAMCCVLCFVFCGACYGIIAMSRAHSAGSSL